MPREALARLLNKLDGVKRHGAKYQARCPAHDDRTPSLSVGEGEDGRVLVHCHAGCTPAAILGAVGLNAGDLFSDPRKDGRPEVVAMYDYCDEAGELLYQTVRYLPKGFRQRRPDGRGGWIWNLAGTRRVLFRLPEILRVVAAGDPIWVAEGEKDVLALVQNGVAATCNPMGAGKWRPEYSETLRGARVIVVRDKDTPGYQHAADVSRQLAGIASAVQVVEAAAGHDAAAHFAAGKTLHDFLPVELSAETSRAEPAALGEEPSAQTQAESLLALASDAEMFHTPEGRAYATVPLNGHRETWALGQQGLRLWLGKRFYDTQGKPAGKAALDAALDILRAQALYDGEERSVFVRLGEDEDRALYLDLGSPEWTAVKITVDGWELVSEPRVRFRRPKGMAMLPTPERGGSLDLLRPLVNLPDEEQWVLYRAWLLATLWPRGPYAILVIEGEQGSAKSGLARTSRALIDPCTALLRSAPREERDLMIAATNSRIVAYDNFSAVRDWLSDALCRLSTGGGMSTRGLYTDDEEFIFDAQRPVVLTGIANLCERDDLRDRALILTLPTIPETARRDEAALWAEFLRVRPLVLGALLDALSIAMRRLDGIRLDRPPRMADFARFAVAAEPGLGIPDGGFMRVYDASRTEAAEKSIELHPLATAVRDLAAEFAVAAPWEGTPTELLTALSSRVPDQITKDKQWPKNARNLSVELARLRPTLRRIGVTAEQSKAGDRKRTRLYRIYCDLVADAGGRRVDAGGPAPRPQGIRTAEQELWAATIPADAADAGSASFSGTLSDEDLEEREERLAIQHEGRAA